VYILAKIIGYILLYVASRKWTGRKIDIKVLIKILILYFFTAPTLQKALNEHQHLIPFFNKIIDVIFVIISMVQVH
jgi:hypothetical protein